MRPHNFKRGQQQNVVATLLGPQKKTESAKHVVYRKMRAGTKIISTNQKSENLFFGQSAPKIDYTALPTSIKANERA